MTLPDRQSAGHLLAEKLSGYADRKDVVVLGIPRGGIPVASKIALALRLPLDVFLSRKLGVPGEEELGFGAVTEGGGRFLYDSVIRGEGIADEEVERVTQRATEVLRERAAAYRHDQPLLEVRGKTVILVDDGVATGATIYAAILALRQRKPASIVLAVPVLPASTRVWLERSVDQLIFLAAPSRFSAVGEFYRDFTQTDEKEVLALLAECREARDRSELVPMQKSRVQGMPAG